MTSLELAACRGHVRQLARHLGVELVWVRSWGQAEAHHAARIVRVPRIESGRDYLVCLHELGHCASAGSRRLNDTPGRELIREAWAWQWAAEHCLPELAAALSQKEWLQVGWAFGSYIKWHALAEDESATLDPSAGTAPATSLEN